MVCPFVSSGNARSPSKSGQPQYKSPGGKGAGATTNGQIFASPHAPATSTTKSAHKNRSGNPGLATSEKYQIPRPPFNPLPKKITKTKIPLTPISIAISSPPSRTPSGLLSPFLSRTCLKKRYERPGARAEDAGIHRILRTTTDALGRSVGF